MILIKLLVGSENNFALIFVNLLVYYCYYKCYIFSMVVINF